MDETLHNRLHELSRLSLQGAFGAEAQMLAQEYAAVPEGMDIFIKVVHALYRPKATPEDAEVFRVVDLFCRLLIVVYRDARKQDADVAAALLNSLLQDYPGKPGTCLYSKWETLGRAAATFKMTRHDNQVVIWEQSKSLFQAYNEFLNGLLGFLIIGWRCALGRPINADVLNKKYRAKLNEFTQLTNGVDGAFGLICQLARPDVRNAIAHGDIWHDTTTGKIRYTHRDQPQEMDLFEFLGCATVGSHLPQAYLSALAAIVVLEEGSGSDVARLPPHLIQLYHHQRPE
jgi:hypothetical protein